jgi:biotin carboxyl carrier protein
MRKYVLSISGKEYKAEVNEMTTEYAQITVNGEKYQVNLKEFGREKEAVPIRKVHPVTTPSKPISKPFVSKPAMSHDAEGVKAPLPGLILEIMVRENDTVKAGQNLIVMEAMKMENQVQAPIDGTVNKIYIEKGDTVSEGDVLLELSRPLMTTL